MPYRSTRRPWLPSLAGVGFRLSHWQRRRPPVVPLSSAPGLPAKLVVRRLPTSTFGLVSSSGGRKARRREGEAAWLNEIPAGAAREVVPPRNAAAAGRPPGVSAALFRREAP